MILTQLDIWAEVVEPVDVVEVKPSTSIDISLPVLSLNDMGRAWYITAGGCVRPVNDTAHIAEFTAMVNVSIQRLKPKVRASLILARAGLDYSQLLDRWYILDELAAVNARFPLFRTQEEALLMFQ